MPILQGATKNYNLLLVDDDPFILEGIGEDLEQRGYCVTRVRSGEEAIDWLQRASFDLVITDLVMPAMSGRELVEHIRQRAPATRVICTSGYVWPAGQEGDGAYLQKPFTSRELLLKVKQALRPEPAGTE